MRPLAALFLLLATLKLPAQEQGPPQLPEDLKLTSGVVLHKINVVRWEKAQVVIHHLGGTDPIVYRYIAEPQRTVMLALRDAELAKAPAPRPHPAADATAEPMGDRKFSGQCYVNGQAGGGAVYKMSGVQLLILPPEAVERFADNNATIILPMPLQKVTTDADGRFEFSLPDKQEFFVVAQSYRIVGGQRVYFHWRFKSTDIKDPGHIVLNSDNSTGEAKKLTFDHER